MSITSIGRVRWPTSLCLVDRFILSLYWLFHRFVLEKLNTYKPVNWESKGWNNYYSFLRIIWKYLSFPLKQFWIHEFSGCWFLQGLWAPSFSQFRSATLLKYCWCSSGCSNIPQRPIDKKLLAIKSVSMRQLGLCVPRGLDVWT